MTLIALSASYGAAGTLIAPAVAEQLGVPFVDRAIPMRAAESIDWPDGSGEAASRGGWLERALRGFVGAEAGASGPVATLAADSDEFRRESEALLRRQANSGAGVILGRAAVAVLRDDPRVLRVRLDGPPERRIAQAVSMFDINPEAAAHAVHKLDAMHDAYLERFYGADIQDTSLYHLVIDSTVLPVQTCVEVIVRVAAGYLA